MKCDECPATDATTMDDPFTTGQGLDGPHVQMTLCERCAENRFLDS